MATRTDPMMPRGTGTVGGSRQSRTRASAWEELGPTQTKPAIFDARAIAWPRYTAKRAPLPFGMMKRELPLGGKWFDQIQSIAIEILKYRHGAIWLVPRIFDETNTPLRIGEMVSREIIRLQKQEHATTALIADGFALPLAYSSRQ